MSTTKTQSRYSESLLRNYFTRIGEHVEVKNLERGQFGTSIRALATSLRDENTDTRGFRELASFLYRTYVVPEFLQTLATVAEPITTGNNVTYFGLRFEKREIILVDIPTAGTLVTEHIFSVLNNLSGATDFRVHKGVVDMTRIEGVGGMLRHDKMRVKISPIGPNTCAVLADIMNASGGTYESAIKEVLNPNHLAANGSVTNVFVAALISSVEGIERVAAVLNSNKISSKIVSIAVDQELDERKYIVPGLGDAGDRMCNR